MVKRVALIGGLEPDFIGGAIPPPRSRPGERHPLWRRSHYWHFVETGEWPKDAYT